MENFETQQPFPRGGGEMGELIRNFDWGATSVGPIENWPLSLKNTVSTMLYSKFPMFLFWGEDNIQFYNDAYRNSLGNNGKHPKALGQKAIDCWPEIWETVGGLLYKVYADGEGVWFAGAVCGWV